MKMQIREDGSDILIELQGLAGQQQRILRALLESEANFAHGLPIAPSRVYVRAGADRMQVRIRSEAGETLDTVALYRQLKAVLYGTESTQEEALVPA